MPVKFQISDDTESKLGRFQQALTMSDFKIKIQACDGIVVTSALHIASDWVRDMVRDRGWCLNDGYEPVIFLPEVEKRIVTLLDRLLTSGSAEITLHERGNIHKIREKLQRSAQDLGLKLFNVDVRPVNQEKLEDTNNNKVVDTIQIDDDEHDDLVTSDSESIEYDELESEVSSHENPIASNGISSTSLVKVRFGQPVKTENEIEDITNNVQLSFEGAPSSFGDIASERVADFNVADDELFEMSQGSCQSETDTDPPVKEIGPAEEVKSGEYYCSQCNKKFNREVKLKHHIEAHHGPRESI